MSGNIVQNQKKIDRFHGFDDGTIMIVTMWVIFALAAMSLMLARTVRVELAGGANYVVAVQVETAVDGVLRWLLAEFAGTDGVDLRRPFAEGAPWLVGEVYVWVLPAGGGAGDEVDPDVFAVRDEGGLININAVSEDVLSALPMASTDLVEAIIDWRWGGENAVGAGIDGYSSQEDSYQRKQGPFETVEELLLLPGFSSELLFGSVYARDVYAGLDNFPRPTGTLPRFDSSELGDKGWFDYVTVYTRQPGQRRQRQQEEGRVDVNQADSRVLRELLRPVVSGESLSETVTRLRRNQPFENLLDFFYHTELSVAEFEPLFELIEVGRNGLGGGLLNINTAPRRVLLCLPGIGESEADRLIGQRRSLDSSPDNILWIAEVLPRETAVPLGNLVTVNSYQFSAEILAMDRDERVFRRYRTVVDAGVNPPRVLYWKDLTHLGRLCAQRYRTHVGSAGGPDPAFYAASY